MTGHDSLATKNSDLKFAYMYIQTEDQSPIMCVSEDICDDVHLLENTGPIVYMCPYTYTYKLSFSYKCVLCNKQGYEFCTQKHAPDKRDKLIRVTQYEHTKMYTSRLQHT